MLIKQYVLTCGHCGDKLLLSHKKIKCSCGKMVVTTKSGNRVYIKSVDEVKPTIEPCWVDDEGNILTLEDILGRIKIKGIV